MPKPIVSTELTLLSESYLEKEADSTFLIFENLKLPLFLY